MFNCLVISSVTLFLSFAGIKQCCAQQSPCPQYFNYQYDGRSYYGSIEVPPPQPGASLTVEIQMSIKSALPDYNRPGSLQLEKSKEAANEDVNAGRNIRYRVNFPLLNPLPVLTGLKYNGQLICSGRPEVPGPGEQVSTIQLHHTIHTTTSGYQYMQIVPQQNPQPQQPPIQQIPQQQPPPPQPSPPQSTSTNPYQSNPFLSGLFSQNTKPNLQSPSNGLRPSTSQTNTYQWNPPQNNGGQQTTLTVYLDDGTKQVYPLQSNGQTQTDLSTQIVDLIQPNSNNNAVKPVKPQTAATVGPNFWVSEPTQPVVIQPSASFPSLSPSPEPVPVTVPTRVTKPTTRPSVIENTSDSNECGNPLPSLNMLAIGGEQTKRGEWPWIVAIFKQKVKSSTVQLDYYCSGTLVSRDLVITAAHCIRTSEGEVVKNEEIQIHIGRSNFEDLAEQGSIIQKPRLIEPHPDYKIWDTMSSDADIAVIRLRERVKFTQFIRPVCLWEETKTVQEIVHQRGVVVGWGRDGTGEVTKIPYKVFLSPVTNDMCIKSNDAFEYIISPRTFCAGSRDKKGPCNGDSGAGWVLKRGDGKWYLRGVVSASLPDPDRNNLCDLTNYVVFTDTARYMDWIKKFL